MDKQWVKENSFDDFFKETEEYDIPLHVKELFEGERMQMSLISIKERTHLDMTRKDFAEYLRNNGAKLSEEDIQRIEEANPEVSADLYMDLLQGTGALKKIVHG